MRSPVHPTQVGFPPPKPQVLETRSELDNLDALAGCPLLQLHPDRYQPFLQVGGPCRVVLPCHASMHMWGCLWRPRGPTACSTQLATPDSTALSSLSKRMVWGPHLPLLMPRPATHALCRRKRRTC